MWHALGRTEIHTGFCWTNIKETHRLGDIGMDRVTLKEMLK